jgi:hypothetical protein
VDLLDLLGQPRIHKRAIGRRPALLLPDPDAVLETQLGVDPRSAIDASTGLVDL